MTVPLSHPLSVSKPLRLGLLTQHNPYDRRAFSGSAYFAARALERCAGVQLSILGRHRAPHPFDRILRRSSPELRLNDISLEGCDAVVGLVASHLLEPLLAQGTTIPLVHVTDATPAFLRDAYGWSVPKEADGIEKRLAAGAAATVYSSSVMAKRAAQDLGLPGLQPRAIPFGINLDDSPAQLPQKSPLSKLNLLFVGLDWARKGGDIAVAALDRLRAAGVDAHLTVVGRCPEKYKRHRAITVAGFLNKNRPRDAAKLNQLYTQAHLLLLPSRGDCTPMVLGEAMAFGTPALASDTGGIHTVIGGTGAGKVLAANATAQVWADEIRSLTNDPDRYLWMSDAAFDRATNTLSWDAWASSLEGLLRQIVAPQPQTLRVVA